MPKFTNSLTGSVVNVDEATAAQLGAEYVPTEQPKADSEQKPKTRRTRNTN